MGRSLDNGEVASLRFVYAPASSSSHEGIHMGKVSAAKKVRNSQDALVCAETFQKLAEKLFPAIWSVNEGSYHVMPNEMGDVVACATNLAFAVELYLKGLLTQMDLPVPAVHDLRVLY